jgi:hypothetical protein
VTKTERMGDEDGEEVEPAAERPLERAAHDRADERRDARVGLPDLELAARAGELDRQHPGRVRDLLREVDLEVTEHLAVGPVGEPAPHRGVVRSLDQLTALLDDGGCLHANTSFRPSCPTGQSGGR